MSIFDASMQPRLRRWTFTRSIHVTHSNHVKCVEQNRPSDDSFIQYSWDLVVGRVCSTDYFTPIDIKLVKVITLKSLSKRWLKTTSLTGSLDVSFFYNWVYKFLVNRSWLPVTYTSGCRRELLNVSSTYLQLKSNVLILYFLYCFTMC